MNHIILPIERRMTTKTEEASPKLRSHLTTTTRRLASSIGESTFSSGSRLFCIVTAPSCFNGDMPVCPRKREKSWTTSRRKSSPSFSNQLDSKSIRRQAKVEIQTRNLCHLCHLFLEEKVDFLGNYSLKIFEIFIRYTTNNYLSCAAKLKFVSLIV